MESTVWIAIRTSSSKGFTILHDYFPGGLIYVIDWLTIFSGKNSCRWVSIDHMTSMQNVCVFIECVTHWNHLSRRKMMIR